MKITSTLSGQKEEFIPQGDEVKMYVCGITPQSEAHIGHAMSYINFDAIRRYLKFRGYKVKSVQNFTDIDDKIINKAAALGVSISEMAEKNMAEFMKDMDALNVSRMDLYPRATQEVPKIIEMVQGLVDKGYAYPAEGSVYFRVTKLGDYGKLAHRTLDQMLVGARIKPGDEKENPMDFAMWKAAKPGEPSWDSPWGKGRPGWHIECSVMAAKFLGQTFDIHGGGKDLIFPHHENEIAQSEAAFGQTMARYWLHNGFVNIAKEKMSKSLGNFLTIKQVTRRFHPEALRLFFFTAHYRSPVDFTEESLQEAQDSLDRFYNTLARIQALPAGDQGEEAEDGGPLGYFLEDMERDLVEAMDDDFNTATAMAKFFEALHTLNAYVNDPAFLKEPGALALLKRAGWELKRLGQVLGLFGQDPVSYCREQQDRCLKELKITPAEIEQKIAARAEARKKKDFASADQIRKELLDRGIALEDGPKGTTWRVEKKISEKS